MKTLVAGASAIMLALLSEKGGHARVPTEGPVLSEHRESKGSAPLDAITTILDAFRTHPVVGLEEEHGDEGSHAFRLSLIRDPRFPGAVNDILVEFGNSRYQDIVDRFIGGEPVADENLRKIWQNTTQAHTIWDRPIYEDFYRAVRAINATLPSERRLRVLLGIRPSTGTQCVPQTTCGGARLREASTPRTSSSERCSRSDGARWSSMALFTFGSKTCRVPI